jgi:DNA polymerase (family 10)
VEGPLELAQAVEAGRLRGVAGFGERKIEQLRQGLAALGAGVDGGSRRPLLDAWEIAEELRERLRASAPVDELVVAGSLRRCRETVGDLDLLAISREPAKVFASFLALPGLLEVRSKGDTKSTYCSRRGSRSTCGSSSPRASAQRSSTSPVPRTTTSTCARWPGRRDSR